MLRQRSERSLSEGGKEKEHVGVCVCEGITACGPSSSALLSLSSPSQKWSPLGMRVGVRGLELTIHGGASYLWKGEGCVWVGRCERARGRGRMSDDGDDDDEDSLIPHSSPTKREESEGGNGLWCCAVPHATPHVLSQSYTSSANEREETCRVRRWQCLSRHAHPPCLMDET